eukprot:TRINITY_DN42016_c0_g1_i1.p1 TRINITY_DN42016_c0_g1~~TRINITY_DN42016_c0_g1_i1.p1  ORF type:complete len:715 (+),score=154.51 TRINITY_DN42016_c0_g1_i1:125-2269(+)
MLLSRAGRNVVLRRVEPAAPAVTKNGSFGTANSHLPEPTAAPTHVARPITSLWLGGLLRDRSRRGFGTAAAPSSTSKSTWHQSSTPVAFSTSSSLQGGQPLPLAWASGPGHSLLQRSDEPVYEAIFEPFGVTPAEFTSLMARGSRYRAGTGGCIVEGGKPYDRIALVLTGEATAFNVTTVEGDAAFGLEGLPGEKSCKYVGKLQPLSEDDDDDDSVPLGGCVIGGSALVYEVFVTGPYPANVVATKPTEWVEWDREVLREMLANGHRSSQASFLHLLYVDLVCSRDKAKATQLRAEEAEKAKEVSTPTARQLLSLTAFVAVPFFGFGFADNAIMISCGDTIDAHFGAAWGLTTLAAAGLGNWVSDVVGLGLGDVIERSAIRLGLNDGGITSAQQKLQMTRFVSLSARIIGISLGCLFGMFPLLFLTPRKIIFTNEELEVYDTVFLPSGVSTTQFASLMEAGTRQSANVGSVVVPSGSRNARVLLVLHGEAHGFKPGERDQPVLRYTPRLQGGEEVKKGVHEAASSTASSSSKPSRMQCRGSIIGGSALRDPSISERLYQYDVIAVKPMEWIEWNIEELRKVCEEEKAIQASFFSMLYDELLQSMNKDRFRMRVERYKESLQACIADGVVSTKERELLQHYRHEHAITEEEHTHLLSELGWTQAGWERGFQFAGRERGHSDEEQPDAVVRLEEALPLIEQALLDLKLRHASASNP